MIGNRLLAGSSNRARTSTPSWNTMYSGLFWKPGESTNVKSAAPTSTSEPGFQMKR